MVSKGHEKRYNLLLGEIDKKYPELQDEIFKLALKGDREGLIKICQNKNQNIEQLCSFMDDTLSNVFSRIGYDWESTKISIAQEHLTTATLDYSIEQLFSNISKKSNKNLKVLVASAPKENHGLGMNIGIKILKLLGIDVINLGCDIPLKDLENIIYEQKPDSVVLSITLLRYLAEIDLMVKSINNQGTNMGIEFIFVGHALSYVQNKNMLSAGCVLDSYSEFYKHFLEK